MPGRYRIERELGRGGMATVYLADDLKHGRKVAIKVMRPELAVAIGQDRFLQEIEVAARLNHPHVLPLFDSGSVDGRFFYVMPWIEGESLRARLRRERQLPLEDALRLAREIASALGHAHRHGLVHRDIKPENVLLADGIALVADFGIARGPADGALTAAATVPATTHGSAVGTPLYMAPEQTLGAGSVDGRTDQYALGCTLYEMLAGQPPFTAATVSALFARHRNDPVPPLASARPGLPEGVVRVIEKTLSKSPADRYPSMARFAEALDAAGSGLSTPVPAPATDDGTRRNNLPRERTHFIGRERVLAECTRTLGDARLLTLTGVGGCGKTRLALQLAGQSMTTYPDGVWFVELAPLLEPDRVPLALAKVLGVMEAPGTVLVETVVAHLAPLRSLIVLDNCEHLMSAVCELSDRILAGTESTTLVATSREGLGVEGERLIAVQSLSVPPAGRAGTDAIESSESVRLFLDRARIVDAGFTLDSENAPTIAEICRRLDGIALAIELAAARVRLLSVDEILARLDDRFRLLTGGARTALPRHQTLLATIEWSYDLLTDAERRLFRHLAVFAGGWTIAAATAVRGEHADEFEVLDLLGRLVGKSLVVVDREPDHSTRYSMLETVRQYVRQKLRDAGEGDAARARHFEYFLSLAEAFPEYAAGPGIDAHRARLVREQENLLAAIELCDHMPDGGEKGLRITGAVLNSWMNKGHLELCRGVAETTLARSGAQGATAYRARVLRSAGVVAFLQHRRVSAQTMLEEALSICRELDDRAGAIRALGWLANVRVLFGELESARQCNEEALALARRLGQPLLLASAASSLAELERLEGHFDQAVPLYEEAVATYRVAGDTNGLGNNLYNVATIHLARGDIAVTRQRLGELASMSEVDNNRLLGMCALDLTSMLACATGFMTDAARLAGTAQANLEWLGVGRYPVDEQAVRPFILRTREGLGDAAFEEAFAAGRALTYEQALAEVRAWLAGAGNA